MYKLSPLRIKQKEISERQKLHDFLINYTVRAWLAPIQAKVKIGPLYLIRTHGDPSYIP